MQLLSRMNQKTPILSSLVSIILGLIVGAILMLVAGYDPLIAYGALFRSGFLDTYGMGESIRTLTPLIFTGLAVALAFRTGLFNIGVEGQLIVGQLAAVIVALKLDLPPGLHATVAVLAGGLAGGLWAFLPGLLKAIRGVHEVITTIMMNFIALYLSNVLVRTWLTSGADSTDPIPQSASLKMAFLSEWFGGARIHFGFFIALFMALVMYLLLWRTTWGYQMRAVGFNPDASEYAGINVRKNIILSMMISGSFAGLAGAGEVLGTYEYHFIQDAFSGIGFDGIAVALLGANTPIGVLLSSVLFGVLTFGGSEMQYDAQVPFEVIRVVFAAIILFVAANVTSWFLERFRLGRKGDSHE